MGRAPGRPASGRARTSARAPSAGQLTFVNGSPQAGGCLAHPLHLGNAGRDREVGMGESQGGPMRRVRAPRWLFLCLLSSIAAAQQPAGSSAVTTPPAAPAPPPDDVRMIRYKISARDLPSAESILEMHREEKGEDGNYIMGLAWVARGAALTGDWKVASRYAARAREIAQAQLSTPADYDSHREAVYALGTSIEVQAQAL